MLYLRPQTPKGSKHHTCTIAQLSSCRAPCAPRDPYPTSKVRNTTPAPSRNHQAAEHRAHHETHTPPHLDHEGTTQTTELAAARRCGPGRTRLASERALTERCANSGAAPPAPQHRRQLLATRYLPSKTLSMDVFRPPPALRSWWPRQRGTDVERVRSRGRKGRRAPLAQV